MMNEVALAAGSQVEARALNIELGVTRRVGHATANLKLEL
jgi:hypothetical protein